MSIFREFISIVLAGLVNDYDLLLLILTHVFSFSSSSVSIASNVWVSTSQALASPMALRLQLVNGPPQSQLATNA
jgi:hypothetical protein